MPARLTLIFLFQLLTGCASVGGFEISQALPERTVAGNPLGGLLGGFVDVPIPLDVDVASQTAARDTGPATALRLTDLRLRITSTEEPPGDEDDFAFIESAEVFVASAASDSTLPRVRVATASQPPAGARELVFTTDSSVDLLPYAREGAELSAEASGEAPPDDVSFDGAIVLAVEVL